MKILRIDIVPTINGTGLDNIYQIDTSMLHFNILSQLSKMTRENFDVIATEKTFDIPVKEDGYKYSDEEYFKVLKGETKEHRPDFMDYKNFIENFNLIERKNREEFDEVHIMGAPWLGAFESRVIGKDAFYCNSGPYFANCENFAIMGWNFERGVQEAVEAYMHRAEFTLERAYPKFWKQFSKDVGTVHCPHNTKKDYDWGNKTDVLCYADKYIMNPYEFVPVMRNSEYWGSNGLGYFEYWFSHIPQSKVDVIVHPDKINNIKE